MDFALRWPSIAIRGPTELTTMYLRPGLSFARQTRATR
jgi:hypothetical protein